MVHKRIAVYCGAREGTESMHTDEARSLGEEIARSGFGLVYGGASIGLMGEVADAALAEGGEVIGVLPNALLDHELPHKSITHLEIVPSFHSRKARIIDLADGFIALSGGIGTLEELLEVTTLRRIGVHQKPIGVLTSSNYYQPLKELIEKCGLTGFSSMETSKQWIEHDSPEQLVSLVGTQIPDSSISFEDCEFRIQDYEDLIPLVLETAHARTLETLPRRIMKVMEELGELNQAYLSVSSPKGTKSFTWSAVREELSDLFIVVCDCLLTRLPRERNMSETEFKEMVCSVIAQKVFVWRDRLRIQPTKSSSGRAKGARR